MKDQESFVVHYRPHFTREILNRPVHKELTYSKMSNLNLLTGSWNEAASFVVDWEVRDVERLEFHAHHESSENDTLSFIADW